VLCIFTLIKENFSCVVDVGIQANSVASERFEADRIKDERLATLHILKMVNAHLTKMCTTKMDLDENSECIEQLVINGASPGELYRVMSNTRHVGDGAEKGFTLNLPYLINTACEQMAVAH
jgi:hypothetical protein